MRRHSSQQAHEALCCSFCRKQESVVGRLIANPSNYPRAYICDECIVVCYSIMQDDSGDPLPGNPVASELLTVVEKWSARESAGQDASQELSEMRKIARAMFAPETGLA